MPILDTIKKLEDYPFAGKNIAEKVLMVSPDYYKVEYSINPYMKDDGGNLPLVDEKRALFQWEKLKSKIEEIGPKVYTINGQEGLPDMVFSANQILPLDSKRVLASRMAHKEREKEVAFVAAFFENHGYEVKTLPPSVESFEGTGDGIWHHGMELLWVGHGMRTSYSAIEFLANDLSLPVAPLELVDENFYHLDTCFAVLNSKTVVWTPKAFSPESQKLIDTFFPETIEVPYEEAHENFSCNCWSVDGKNVIIPSQTPLLKKKLLDHGLIVHELDTSEYLKSGGSVFCLKQFFF